MISKSRRWVAAAPVMVHLLLPDAGFDVFAMVLNNERDLLSDTAESIDESVLISEAVC